MDEGSAPRRLPITAGVLGLLVVVAASGIALGSLDPADRPDPIFSRVIDSGPNEFGREMLVTAAVTGAYHRDAGVQAMLGNPMQDPSVYEIGRDRACVLVELRIDPLTGSPDEPRVAWAVAREEDPGLSGQQSPGLGWAVLRFTPERPTFPLGDAACAN